MTGRRLSPERIQARLDGALRDEISNPTTAPIMMQRGTTPNTVNIPSAPSRLEMPCKLARGGPIKRPTKTPTTPPVTIPKNRTIHPGGDPCVLLSIRAS
jgi:hypothetical protein